MIGFEIANLHPIIVLNDDLIYILEEFALQRDSIIRLIEKKKLWTPVQTNVGMYVIFLMLQKEKMCILLIFVT